MNTKQRELSDGELVALAAVHIGPEFAQAFAAMIEPDYAMDETTGEITAYEWPSRTLSSLLLVTWKPVGKPS